MAETTLPKLHVSREEAYQKIQARIEKGRQLRNKEIRTDDELEKARAKAKNGQSITKFFCLGYLITRR